MDDEDVLARKLRFLWQRPDILEKILEESGLKTSTSSRRILDEALVEALARNEMGTVEKLLQRGASIDQFYMGHQASSDDALIALIRQASR